MSDVICRPNTLTDIEDRIHFNIRAFMRTFGISMAALYFEILIIRYIGTEIRIFAYLKNVALLAGFCGIGVGMVLPDFPTRLNKWFPALFASVFLTSRYSQLLGLTHVGVFTNDDFLWGLAPSRAVPFFIALICAIVLAALFS